MEDAAPPPRRADRLSWAVFLVLAVIYRWGRCPSFGGGDSPLVVYHALFTPAQDFFSAIAWIASRLPFDSPEGNVNALSGLFHAGAAALLFATLRRLGIKRVPAVTAVSFLAFSRRYWYFALVADFRPAIVFGLALAIWGIIAWKDEAKAWPLAYSFIGILFATVSPIYVFGAFPVYLRLLSLGFIPSYVTISLWIGALIAALLLQRIDLASPPAARCLLAVSLIIPILRPYTLKSHNPTLEWAQAATESFGKSDRFAISEFGLQYAIAYTMKSRFNDYDPTRHFYGSDGIFTIPPVEWRDIRLDLWNPRQPGFLPNGLLLQFQPRLDTRGLKLMLPVVAGEDEIAKRAEAVLALPALSSIGRRDRKKYGFAPEAVLYEEYRGILTRYRELLPNHPELRARLDAQLAEYSAE